MPPDLKQPQKPTPTENPSPVSPESPTLDVPIPPLESTPPEVPPGGLESSPNDFTSKSDNIAPSNSSLENPLSEQNNEGIQAKNPEPSTTTPESASEADKQTPQIPGNEPFNEVQGEPLGEPEIPEPETSKPEPAKPVEENKTSLALGLLVKARNAIQNRKRKKLDRAMSLFLKQSKITNDEVEKLLHVSDATATRYLTILKKEGRIQQSGKTGKGVNYVKL